MRVVSSLQAAQLDEDSVVTIGAFDGIHRGHRAVIESVRRAALEQGRASVVVTFFPHPSVVLGRTEPFYLTSTEEKIGVLNEIGIDLLVVMNFTLEMSRTRAADYVSLLVEQLRLREVHVGYDFVFGYQRAGNIDFLQRLGPEYGFGVRVIEALLNAGEPISSTGIRHALRAGDVELAAQWLGRPFRLSGAASRSPQPGFPVVPLDVWQAHAIPANGAYACWAWAGDLRYKALVDLGARTAGEGRPVRTVDVQLLDQSRSLDGLRVALDFVTRLRERDAEAVRRMLAP
ncbi:MAG TPA: riboflavin kinase [Anaerolineae bacterium]|nr:riboflavin kinase [Anaerolineae bacterium]